MTTLHKLRGSYARQQQALNRRYFESADLHGVNWSINKWMKTKLFKSIRPRGNAYDRVLAIEYSSNKIKYYRRSE